MQRNQRIPVKIVIRSRFRSTTDDEPSDDETPAAEQVGQAAALALVQQHEHAS